MNPIRDKRQYETRKYIKNINFTIDFGSGMYPINPNSNRTICFDINPNTKPDIRSTITNIPIKTNSIEQICLLEIIEHFHKEEQLIVLNEIDRILKPNGYLIITIPNSSSFMKIPQRVIWFVREYTTQRNYHNNIYTHTHIGLISPIQILHLLKSKNYQILEYKRLMLYDYIIVAQKGNSSMV